MTYQTALDATNFLIKNAETTKTIPSINFFGGEPLIKWDEIIVPLTNYIRKEYVKPFTLSMTSNCVLMTEDKLKFMKENNIGLLFSIDGAKTTQDYNRPLVGGGSSFDILKDIVPLILKYHPNMTFRSTIANDTVQYTFENIKFAFDSGYTNTFSVPNVFTEWTDDQKEELKKQMRLFADYFINNVRQGKVLHLNPFDEKIKQINQIDRAFRNNQFRVGGENVPAYGRCGMGANKFASVGTDGTLFGCQELVGNKKDGSVFEIGDIYNGTDEEKRWKLINMFNKKTVKGKNHECLKCKLNGICDGGCVANNYMVNGNINEMPEMLCFWYQLLLEEAIRVTQILGTERNAMFKNTYFNFKRK
jgi:radical SAM protein with 4Fe4S-binding SPASM domain